MLRYKAIVFLILLTFSGGCIWYKKTKNNETENRYVLSNVQKGTLITSVSGSGQVSVLSQVDVKSRASGDIVYLNIKKGQEVKSNSLIAQINTKDAQKAVRDAQTALETANLDLEELLSPPDNLTLLQAENSLTQAKDNLTKLKFNQEDEYQKALDAKQKAKDALKKGYDDGFNAVSNAFLDLPDVISELYNILFLKNFNINQANLDYYADTIKSYDEKSLQYKTDAYNKYQIARKSYDQNFQDYKATDRSSEVNLI